MRRKAVIICQSQLFKDHRILKIIFTIFASYFIFTEFYKFLVVKPTYSSNTKRMLVVEDFPEILLCPNPSVNVDTITVKGYAGVHEYFMGVYEFGPYELVGWAGNISEDVKKVSEDIATLKTIQDCPQYGAIWSQDGTGDSTIQYNLSRALYPYLTCCKVIPPEFARDTPVVGMSMVFYYGSFKMFMADRLTHSYFDLHNTMLGDQIVSGADGIIEYKVQIKEEENLEDDPENPCINYSIVGEYAECLEKELVKQNSKYLNCTPPWMTDKKHLWCDFQLNSSKSTEEILEYVYFLNDIRASEVNPGKCLVPCKVKKYEAKEIGLKQNKFGSRGIYILFEKEVKTTKSAWTIGPLTLISKIGGFIGISKNFLWLIIMVMTSVGVLISKLKEQHGN